MKRIPLIPTIIVGLAIVTMVALGFWQIRRAVWKEALIARYAAAPSQPPMALPNVPDARNPPLYRRASAHCLQIVGSRVVAGRSVNGEPGWSHIAQCRTGAEGPGLAVDIGWSKALDNPKWAGGEVAGIVAPDRKQIYRLVATTPAPGLAQSAPPSLEEIPNNHRSYAVQWFLFAATAAVIYGLALRRR